MKGFWIVATVLSCLFVFGDNEIAGAEKGEIVVEIGDNFLKKKSEINYYLQRKDTSLVPLTREHLRDYPPPRPGQRAILSPKGKLYRSKKPKKTLNLGKVEGEIRVLIALIQPANEDIPWERDKALEYIEPLQNFFKDLRQHSKVTLLSVEMIGWLKSEKTREEFGGDGVSLKIIDTEVIPLLDDDIDFRQVDCLFVVVADSNRSFSIAWASIGKWGYNTNDGLVNFSCSGLGSYGFSFSSVVAHEAGHAICSQFHGAGENLPKTDCGYNKAVAEEYNDSFDVMGYAGWHNLPFISLLRQYQIGWLNEERVITFSSGFSSAELCPREIIETEKKQLGLIETGTEEFFTLEVFCKNLEPYLNQNFYETTAKSLLLLRRHIRTGGYDSVVFLPETTEFESFLRPGEEICGLGPDKNISIRYVSLTGEGEEAIASVEVTIEGVPEPTPTPTPIPTPTPMPTPTPTPTPCEAYIRVFPSALNLARKGREKVEVTVAAGWDDCTVEGAIVTATINAPGKKRISVSPSSAITDENGQATFTITAKKKGNSKVTFKAGDVKKSIIVKVR